MNKPWRTLDGPRSKNSQSCTNNGARAGVVRHPSGGLGSPKPGSPEKRPLGIPAVRDRSVQRARRHVWEPIFETEFAAHR